MATKRGNKEGHFRERPNGTWEGRVLLGFRNGKPQRLSRYGKTRAEVVRKVDQALRDFEDGVILTADKQTVRDFMTRWVEDCARPRLKPRSYDGYKQHIEQHIVPGLGHFKLRQLTSQHVQRLVTEKSKAGLAPRTVRYMRAVLRAALNDAVAWRLITGNPAQHISMARVLPHQFRVLDAEQARTFIATIAAHRLVALFTVALATGLRIGEALALDWADVDLEAPSLRVRRTLVRRKQEVFFGTPKSETSRRIVVLPPFAVDALLRHQAAQKGERFAVGAGWKEHGLVFTTPIGTPLDGSNVSKLFKKLIAEAGLPPMRLHDLRHTCATLLFAQKVTGKLVQATLGHSQISLTLDTYSHVLPAMGKEVADQMQAAIKP